MVWYFIGVYMINRTFHGRLEIRNFSSRVEKVFHSKRNFVALHGHVISSMYNVYHFIAYVKNIITFICIGLFGKPLFWYS